MRIPISHFPCNLTGTFGSTAKQLLCLVHAKRSQILNKCLSHILAEKRTEMIGTHIRRMRHSIQRNLFIHIMSIYKIYCLLQHTSVLTACIFITDCNGPFQDFLCICNRSFCRLACLLHNIICLFSGQFRIIISNFLKK